MMIAKIWTKLGLVVLIIACLFNIMIKIITKISLQDQINESASYVRTMELQKEEANDIN